MGLLVWEPRYLLDNGSHDGWIQVPFSSQEDEAHSLVMALKRSFEVEEKFQDLGVKNSEPAARHVDSLSQRSPKAALRRVELSGPKAEPVSRRTEISIDISSKQTPEPAPRRTEITIVKPQESAHRRVETPASKIPEVPAAPAADAAPKRVEADAAPKRERSRKTPRTGGQEDMVEEQPGPEHVVLVCSGGFCGLAPGY
ncbi:hypothetical protein CB1_000299020 [Camelus ferus]|nr:hypothetical protein CB1_000299020 [Camelus ferus]